MILSLSFRSIQLEVLVIMEQKMSNSFILFLFNQNQKNEQF